MGTAVHYLATIFHTHATHESNYLHNVIAKFFIADWILEKRSKPHNRSFEINGFKDLKPL